MKDKESYLESYNEENSSTAVINKINKKIATRLLIFMICSLIYLVVSVISRITKAHDIQTQFINSFVDTIMTICFIISFISLVLYVIILISPKFYEKLDHIKFKTKKVIFYILDWGVILPASATLATICFAFFFTPAKVNGESMYPTIDNDSTVILSYLDKIDRYDVVVAYITVEDSVVDLLPDFQVAKYPEYYIKRVIGVPGDTVTWINGILTVNNEVVDEYYFSKETKREHVETWTERTGFFGTFKYKKNGKVFKTTVIPEGYYFVMGDHRDNSTDSRMIGLVPKKNIEGVAKLEISSKGIERII